MIYGIINMPQENSWDKSSTTQKHKRMRKRLEKSKPLRCPLCNEIKKLELSNKDHKYNEDPQDWQYLCHQCHYHYDIENNNYRFYKVFNSLFS